MKRNPDTVPNYANSRWRQLTPFRISDAANRACLMRIKASTDHIANDMRDLTMNESFIPKAVRF